MIVVAAVDAAVVVVEVVAVETNSSSKWFPGSHSKDSYGEV